MGPENAQIMAQLTMLAKAIRNIGGGSDETPLGDYIARYDRGEEYFQEDGKGYLVEGGELTDPARYDTKAYPLMNVMPTLHGDYNWTDGLNPPNIDPANTVQWTWATNDDTRIILGTQFSFSVSSDGVNWKTRQLIAVSSRTWSAANDLLHNFLCGMLINGTLYVIATTKSATSTYKLYKLDADLNAATEIPNSTGSAFFTKTNGRYYCSGSNWLYDLTNPAEPVRHAIYSACRDITRWKDEWWVVYTLGLYRTTDLSVIGTAVVYSPNIYCVGSNADELVYVTTNAVMYATDPVTPVFNSATGPETLALGSTATSFKMSEVNGKFLVRGDGNNRIATALNALVEYNPADHTWEELFCPHGYTGLGTYAMPLWYRGEYWFIGNQYTLNGYSRSVDGRSWSGDEIDARLMSSYQNLQNGVSQLTARVGVASDGGAKQMFVYNRHIVYTTDGGVTYRSALGPWKTATFLRHYGIDVFYDGGEFFVLSYRGNWKTTDFVTWVTLDPTPVLQAALSASSFRVIRLPNGVWVSIGSDSATHPTWYSSDRGTTWKVSPLTGVGAVWWDSKRAKYGIVNYSLQIALTTGLDTAATLSNTTAADWFGTPIEVYYDEVLDRIFSLQIASNTINSVNAVQYTTQTPYSTMKGHTGQAPLQSLDASFGSAMTEFVRIGGELYAITNTFGRCNLARPYLSALRFKADRTVDYVPLELPVEGFELTQALMGDRYPVTGYQSSIQGYIKLLGDSHVTPNKKKFFLCGYWFELSLTEPKITLAHSPQAGFERVSKLLQLPKVWRPKFASDGKGTVAFISASVLYVSKNGGEFLPKMTIGAQTIQYGQGIWVLSVLMPTTTWNSTGQVNLALTVVYSKDLENWKSMVFADASLSSRRPVEFRLIQGKWSVLYLSSLYGSSIGESYRIGVWFGGSVASIPYQSFVLRDGVLVDTPLHEFNDFTRIYNILLHPQHGIISGLEFAQYPHGEYALLQTDSIGSSSGSINQDVYVQRIVRALSANGDAMTQTWQRVAQTNATSSTPRRGSIFTDTAVASWTVGNPTTMLSGVECPDFHSIPYNTGGTTAQHWGKHNYFFVQNTNGRGMRLLLSPNKYRVIEALGVDFTVNTTDDGQIFIITGYGAMFRGVKGIHATPRPAKSTGYQYKRVL